MAHETQNNGMLGEISTIRNILMGEQMSQYETRFQEMQSALEEAQNKLKEDLKSTSSGTDIRLTQLEKDVNNRFDKLEKMLADGLAQMNEKIAAISQSDKQNLGKMLAEMSDKLMKE